MPMLIFLLALLFVLGVGWLIHIIVSTSKQMKDVRSNHDNMEIRLTELPDFSPSQKIRASNCILAIDEERCQIAIVDLNDCYKYNFTEVIESEIIQDENTVSKVSRSSQIAGAVIGGALAGGTGALVGGLSANKTTSKKIQKISLKIVFDDLKKPIVYVTVLNKEVPLSPTDHRVVEAVNSISHWQGVFSVIINRNMKINTGS